MNGYRKKQMAAAALRFLTLNGEPVLGGHAIGGVLKFCRSGLYLLLFVMWGIAFQQRTVQPTVKKLLLGVSTVTIFWLVVRTIKYLIAEDPLLVRTLWYSYYIPMLFFPTFCLLIAFYIGKPESFRLPRRYGALTAIPAALALLVMTNDYHQLVFRFPYPKPWLDDGHTYGMMYWVCIGWSVGCAVCMIGLLIRRSRIPGEKKRLYLPFFPLFAVILWGVWNMLGGKWARYLTGDMPVMFCLFFTTTLECCIQCGLLQVNTRYGDLFRISSLAAQITDEDYRVLLSSRQSTKLPRDAMERTQTAPVMLPGDLRLSGAAIRGGHVLWTEDVSELAGIISRLEELDEALKDRHTVWREEYAARHRRQSLAEKNRLYNAMQTQTRDKITALTQRIERLAETQDALETRRLTASIAVITAYLKRRNNLIFIAEESGSIPAAELTWCLRESVNSLRLGGAACEVEVHLTAPLPFGEVTALYDAFETAAEAAMESLEELFVTVSLQAGAPTLCLSLVCGADLTGLEAAGFVLTDEGGGEWTAEYRLRKGGEER